MKKSYLFTTFLVILVMLFASCEQPTSPGTPDAGVDKVELTDAITAANTLKNSKTIGTEVGNVRQTTVDTYSTAIAAAQTVADYAEPTQAEIDAAVIVLATATTAFNNSIIVLNIIFDFDEATAPLLNAFEGGEAVLESDPADAANTVLKFTKPAAAMAWAGVNPYSAYNFSIPQLILTETNKIIRVKIYSPAAGLPITLKIENADDDSAYVQTEVLTTVANTWEILFFDFGNETAGTTALDVSNTYNKITIFPDFLADGADKIFYIDDIVFEGQLGSVLQELPIAITAAITLKDSKTVGTESGNVPQLAVNDYEDAITSAQATLNTAVIADFDAAVTALATATTAFNDSVVLFSAGVPYYVYSTAGHIDGEDEDIPMVWTNWNDWTMIDHDFVDSEYDPVLELQANPDGNGWGAAGAASYAFTVDNAVLTGFTQLTFKVRATVYTSVFVKLAGATTEQLEYVIAEGFDLSNGWREITVDLADFGDKSTSTVFAILNDTEMGALYLTDIAFSLN